MKSDVINKADKIFLTGHNGLVGSAVLRLLKKKKFKNILVVEKKNLDLRDQNKVLDFFSKIKTLKLLLILPQKWVEYMQILFLVASLFMTI